MKVKIVDIVYAAPKSDESHHVCFLSVRCWVSRLQNGFLDKRRAPLLNPTYNLFAP